jgi:alkylhydroperoxidase family enzyme
VDENHIRAISDPRSDLLSPRERAAVDFAGKLAGDHFAITDETYEELRRHFDDTELAELTMVTVSFLGMGRLLETLTRGVTCELPHR